MNELATLLIIGISFAAGFVAWVCLSWKQISKAVSDE